MFENLYIGFSVLFSNPLALLYALIGVVLGVFIGILPGIGPSAGIALLIPITYGMPPVNGIVMMAGMYYGAQYGGSVTSILINVPGESSSIMATLDGYPMAVQGKAGKALGMAAYASVISGTISVIAFMYVAPFIASFAVSFGPAEYLALMLLGLVSVAGLTGKSPAKGYLSAFLGLFIATIGLDVVTGAPRYAFGVPQLFGGVDFLPVVTGVFGITEIICSADEQTESSVTLKNGESLKFKNLFPNKQDWKDCAPHLARGSVLGFILGMLPGTGATIASFLSYDMAKRTSKKKELFGTGIIEGVAAPECANSAASIGAMIPMFTLGIPGSGTTAVMLGALMMFGITPGPSFFANNADVAWGLIASMYLGNVFILILGVFGLPLFVKLLDVKLPILNALVMSLILIGSFSLNNSMFDVGITIFFGALGYVLRKFEVPPAPMVLALVLGPLAEKSLRLAMIIADGNVVTIISKPIVSGILVVVLGMALNAPIKKAIRKVFFGKKATA